MFTGIVQDMGRIAALQAQGGDLRLTIEVSRLSLADARTGDSIAVSGVCLTALELTSKTFSADVSNETLSLTTLGQLRSGDQVNLEPALRAGDALGGHLVSGHVDGLAEVLSVQGDARSQRVRFRVPAALSRYVARKGSVAIDGVSLTVNEVEGDVFGVNLIPHTWEVTTLGTLAPGRRVNLEIDQVARYVERLIGEAR
ncbi:MAG: riboflavin synthase [Gammaproteobacteria bacterium]|jgi:riboflavin synthase|nr:riboflavin synthase [Gammaproteobacteria bacterium]NBX40690.1 riboflavin synthase [Gammaproteobacteria bacterium]